MYKLATPNLAAWFHRYSRDRPGGANAALIHFTTCATPMPATPSWQAKASAWRASFWGIATTAAPSAMRIWTVLR